MLNSILLISVTGYSYLILWIPVILIMVSSNTNYDMHAYTYQCNWPLYNIKVKLKRNYHEVVKTTALIK